MTIDDQIKYEKLQYDVNREAAKISALSSGKFNKYEYLTGEEILPSNKQQLISKVREIIKDIYNKKLDKIIELNSKIDYDNLKYVVERGGVEYDFNKLKDPITFLEDIKNGKMSLEEPKEKQRGYHNYLNAIRKGNKSASQKRTPANINILFNATDNAIKFIEDYGSTIFEAQRLAREQKGTEIKILTSNQTFKRLSIALAQIKAGNNSESLLNEIRQIVYYLYRSKKITKMLYNNIINSVKA